MKTSIFKALQFLPAALILGALGTVPAIAETAPQEAIQISQAASTDVETVSARVIETDPRNDRLHVEMANGSKRWIPVSGNIQEQLNLRSDETVQLAMVGERVVSITYGGTTVALEGTSGTPTTTTTTTTTVQREESTVIERPATRPVPTPVAQPAPVQQPVQAEAEAPAPAPVRALW